MYDSEDDRRRIARELHDDIGQRLAVLADDADQLRRELATSDSATSSRLGSLVKQARDLAEDLRRISHILHPAILEDLGLASAIRLLADDLAHRTGMQVSFTESNPPRHLPSAQSIALYRITQEALRNVARHAGRTAVDVRLAGSKGEILLTISDSGIGFDTARRAGLGLTSMRERASLVGAMLTLTSAPGKGTTIQVRLPFAKSHAT